MSERPLRNNLGALLLVALVVPAIAAACSAGGGESADNDSGTTSGKGGKSSKGGSGGKGGAGGLGGGGGVGLSAGAGGSAGSVGLGGQGNPQISALTVEPAEATITVVDGKATPDSVLFVAKGMTSGGATPVQAAWESDATSVATIDATGKLVATGKAGGLVQVKASYGGKEATAKATVQVVTTQSDGSIGDGDKDQLKNASTPDPSAKIAYPYDQTVFPPAILPPTLMWTGGGPDDAYLARVSSPYGSIEVYTKAPDGRLPLPEQPWLDLTRDARGDKVQLRLTRLAGGQATVVSEQTWPIATGPLRGTVYYWANNLGRVLRIKPGAKQPDDFLAAAGVTDGCTTCHTVSANGSTLVMGGGSGEDPNDSKASVFDLEGDKLAHTADQGYGRRWAMPALTPDGKYAVLNDAPLPGGPGKGGGLYDVGTSQLVPGTALDGLPLDMPYFSADGSALVYVDHGSKGLGAFDYSQPALPAAFTNKRDLVPQAGPSGDGNPIAFPAAAPDGKWAIYHRGTLDSREGPGDLYLASLQQPGVELPLSNLNGISYPFVAGDRDRHYNYEPTFAPLPAGGYFWVIFTSRRTYGTLRTEDKASVKLLWMAAIDLHPEAGKDPSHPAFLLQGQDTSSLNMRAFWVFDPCKGKGEGCQFGSDCCDGFCDSSTPGAPLTCSDGQIGQPGPCVQTGNKCKTTGDCCQAAKGSECINGFCSDPPPDIQ